MVLEVRKNRETVDKNAAGIRTRERRNGLLIPNNSQIHQYFVTYT